MNKPKNIHRYPRDRKADYIKSFLCKNDEKNTIVIATNNIEEANELCAGTIEKMGEDVCVIKPASGVYRIYVNPKDRKYRNKYKAELKRLGYLPDSFVLEDDQVDHALAKTLGNFKWVLLNPVNRGSNASYGGGIERDSKNREFSHDSEPASVLEFYKICEISPAKKGDLMGYLFDGMIHMIESGLYEEAGVSKKVALDAIMESIRESSNNIVREEYEDNKEKVEAAFKEIKSDYSE